MWFADFADRGGCYLIKSHLSQTIFFSLSLSSASLLLIWIYWLLGVHKYKTLESDVMGQLMGEQPAIKYTKITWTQPKDRARQPHPYLPRSRASTCTPVAWDQALPCEKIGSLADQNWNLYSLVSAFNNWKRTQLAWDQAPHSGKKLARRHFFLFAILTPFLPLFPRLRSLVPGQNTIFYKLQLSGVQLYSGLELVIFVVFPLFS